MCESDSSPEFLELNLLLQSISFFTELQRIHKILMKYFMTVWHFCYTVAFQSSLIVSKACFQ